MPTVRLHNKLRQGITVILADRTTGEYAREIGARKYLDVPSDNLTPDVYHKAEKRVVKIRVRPGLKLGEKGGPSGVSEAGVPNDVPEAHAVT